MADPVQIPSKAVSDGDDLLAPLTSVLEGLNLLGSKADAAKAGQMSAVVGGPPQSVALIEAGATALSKWWAAGLGATVLGAWAAIASWWGGQSDPTQRTTLLAASIGTAAAILTIGYIIGSDVRGRASAATATVDARARLGEALIKSAEGVFTPTPRAPSEQLIALAPPLPVEYRSTAPNHEPADWTAIALLSNGETSTKYLVMKRDKDQVWVDAKNIGLP